MSLKFLFYRKKKHLSILNNVLTFLINTLDFFYDMSMPLITTPFYRFFYYKMVYFYLSSAFSSAYDLTVYLRAFNHHRSRAFIRLSCFAFSCGISNTLTISKNKHVNFFLPEKFTILDEKSDKLNCQE